MTDEASSASPPDAVGRDRLRGARDRLHENPAQPALAPIQRGVATFRGLDAALPCARRCPTAGLPPAVHEQVGRTLRQAEAVGLQQPAGERLAAEGGRGRWTTLREAERWIDPVLAARIRGKLEATRQERSTGRVAVTVHDHDALVTSMYAAAHETNGWISALDDLREAFGLDAYVLMRYPPRHLPQSPELICVGGSHVSALADQRYRSYYGAIDPRARFVRDSCVGTVFSCDRHFDDSYVSRSEFYQDFLVPEGLRFCMGTCVRMHDGTDYAMGLQRSAGRGPYGADTSRRFQALLPHLGRSLRIFEQIGRQQARAVATSTALDTLSWATFCLGDNGLYLGGNDLAESLVSDGLLVKAERQVLRFIDARSQGRYSRALEQCLRQRRPGAVLVQSIRLGAGRLTATLLPAEEEARRPSPLPPSLPRVAHLRAVCIVAPLDSGNILSVSQLMSLFGLTPAEARLAAAVAAGDSLESYAAENGVALSTLRTQLHAVFQKVDCDRQAELVRLFANIPALSDWGQVLQRKT